MQDGPDLSALLSGTAEYATVGSRTAPSARLSMT